AAEKALKAAQFSLDATNVRIHDLHMIASCLDDSTLSSLAVQLEGLVDHLITSHKSFSLFPPFLVTSPSLRGSNIECLPQCLKDTGIKNVENLLLVLAYCKHSDKFLKSLHGLPLLLTQDGMLRMFDEENPVFLTTHHTLTPRNASLFVHRNLFNIVFYEALSKSNVFKRFDIAAFAKLLPNNLERKYNVSDEFIEWDPISDNKNDLPSRGWLFDV
ncbi:predicted protein, partial [Nematostella vectensis]